MDVSIIIVNYHTSALIADCLNSITAKTQGLEFEVIIVDNNSEPELESIIRNKTGLTNDSRLHFLVLPENIGFGRANNEGLRIARGRNILFLNPDTILLNNAVKILSDFLDSHSEAGACGGNLYGEDMLPAQSFRRLLPGPIWELDELLNAKIQEVIFSRNKNFNHLSRPLEVGFITGADLLVKRSVLDITGSFSPDFFMYFEETDLCCRIKKAGYKIYSVPDAKIQHLESKSFEDTSSWESEKKTRWLEESRNIYYRRNLSTLHRRFSLLLYRLFLHSRRLLIKKPIKRQYYKDRLRWHYGSVN